MNAQTVYDHLRSLDGGWVDWDATTDRFVAGDPAAQVSGIAVGWMSYSWALRRALELGCNLFISHEPTYFGARDDEDRIFRFSGVEAKRRWVEGSGLTILRCHDLWDQLPGIGIPDSWAEQLGLGEPIAGEGYFRLYDVRGRTARSIAVQVAAKTRELGQDAVQLLGPPDVPVSRLALGTGAITPFPQFLENYAADLALCSDDGFTYWHGGALSIDLGVPVIVVNHAVSEMHGIKRLAEHLRRRFPEVPVHYITQGCMYQLIRAPADEPGS
ncbi:MAG: Nif3-like dinuclear metal center hexameric protein [Chloroflexi bacterium]|nr:Nif3-like dinuclear metal center hexameric protein [Chloroflexota bacterium]